MELVYLWVEDYKNIHNQGFNFSPKFNCDYDGKVLTIDDNPEYIENFFGENINVTAIVGKNGSGKSSIIKLVFILIFCKKYDYELSSSLDDNILELISQFFNKELFLIIFQEKKFKKISMKYFIKQLHTKYGSTGLLLRNSEEIILECNLKISYQENIFTTELKQEELNFFSVHFNYMIDTLFDGKQDKWIKEIYHKADSYDTPLLLEPYKNSSKGEEVINLDIIDYLNNQNMLRFYHELSSNRQVTTFFNPNEISLNIAYRDFDWTNLSDEDFNCLSSCNNFIAYKFFQLYNNDTFVGLRGSHKSEICKICKKIKDLYNKKKYEQLSHLYIVLKVLTSNRSLFNKEECEKIHEWAYDLKVDEDLLKFKNKLNLPVLIKDDAPLYEVMKIQVSINFLKEKIYDKSKFLDNINKKVNLDEVSDILKFIPPWIDTEWYEENKSIKSLSSGEKSFFTFLINLMYQVQNINNEPKYNTINLFLDETELGFHPQWHKEYLNNILGVLKKINKKKINIIFATHSPFLISDLPKNNVMFLKNGVQDKGINYKETFGANIHTLLSDSFFMEKGLMGEFAKSKINEIIDFHKEVEEENKKEQSNFTSLKIRYEEYKIKFWQVQSIIGEDYLKQVIKNHLRDVENILLGYKQAKEEEINRLREEADRLEKMK